MENNVELYSYIHAYVCIIGLSNTYRYTYTIYIIYIIFILAASKQYMIMFTSVPVYVAKEGNNCWVDSPRLVRE